MVTYLAPKILVASSASAGGVEMIIQVFGLVRQYNPRIVAVLLPGEFI